MDGKINIVQFVDAARSFKQDASHIPMLYLIDSDRDGLLTLPDVFNYVQY